MTDYIKVYNEVRAFKASVVLLAVSKTKPFEDIMEAYSEGARLFGENRVQEMVNKFRFPRPEGMKVYLIGQLQRNKVKKAVEYADRIESVDSIPLLEKIDYEAGLLGKRMEILFEVNSSGKSRSRGSERRKSSSKLSGKPEPSRISILPAL